MRGVTQLLGTWSGVAADSTPAQAASSPAVSSKVFYMPSAMKCLNICPFLTLQATVSSHGGSKKIQTQQAIVRKLGFRVMDIINITYITKSTYLSNYLDTTPRPRTKVHAIVTEQNYLVKAQNMVWKTLLINLNC